MCCCILTCIHTHKCKYSFQVVEAPVLHWSKPDACVERKSGNRHIYTMIHSWRLLSLTLLLRGAAREQARFCTIATPLLGLPLIHFLAMLFQLGGGSHGSMDKVYTSVRQRQ
jgi:hypothetical protein